MLKQIRVRFPIVLGALALGTTIAMTALAEQSTPPATQQPATGAASTSTATTQGTKTASGLTIVRLQESEGAAAERDTLWVHFTGTFADGKKFASSVDRGEPVELTLGVGDVLKAWDEGLMGMKVGEKRRVIVPPELAYGKQGQGSLIPPDAELTFDFELVGLRKAPQHAHAHSEEAAAEATTAPAEPVQ